MGYSRTVAALSAVVLCLLPGLLLAIQVQIFITTPFVYIQIGSGRFGVFGLFGPPNQVDEVSFTMPAGTIPGDGTPVVGTPVMPFLLLGYSGGGQANFRVNMNSSTPLINGNGTPMPFSEFSWTTRDGDINGGQFDNSANQLLQQYNYNWPRGRGVIDYLTFSYDNDTIYEAGTYTGRVVYTITLL